jgi:hypothetical protein
VEISTTVDLQLECRNRAGSKQSQDDRGHAYEDSSPQFHLVFLAYTELYSMSLKIGLPNRGPRIVAKVNNGPHKIGKPSVLHFAMTYAAGGGIQEMDDI